MQSFSFDREKYVRMAKSIGVPATLTQLHKDIIAWEIQTFEGKQGYQPKMWNKLEAVREFSRELWDLAAENEDHSSKNEG